MAHRVIERVQSLARQLEVEAVTLPHDVAALLCRPDVKPTELATASVMASFPDLVIWQDQHGGLPRARRSVRESIKHSFE